MNQRSDFYVVGIGLSAGGISALTDLLSNLPQSPGAAFVVISHLPKEAKSHLDKVVARATSLQVSWGKTGQRLEPNHCYLLPAGMLMTVHQGKLHVEPRPNDHVINRTIDIFFSSLAQQFEQRSIGIILSGTGEDGLKGVYAIEEHGGIVMVQKPESATFDGMPFSIVAKDHPDFILTPVEMSHALNMFLKVKKGGWQPSSLKTASR